MHIKYVKSFGRRYPGQIILIPPENPDEAIAPQYKSRDLFCSLAVALIGKSQPHFHERTHEVYVVKRGELHLYTRSCNGGVRGHHHMKPGDDHVIHPHTIHWAECVGEEPAEVEVLAWPPWSKRDHHIVQVEP